MNDAATAQADYIVREWQKKYRDNEANMNDTDDEIKLDCPNCGQHLSIQQSMLNMELKCPRCSQTFTVVSENSASEVEANPEPFPEPNPAHHVITTVRRGISKRKRHLRMIGVAASVIAIACIATVLAFGKGRDSQRDRDDWNDWDQMFSSVSAPNPTESEKMAMGRVFYAYAKVEGIKSQLSYQLSSTANNEGEAAAAQFLAGLVGLGVAGVDTEGCPDDFANAWKDFASSVAVLDTAEKLYKVMVMGLQYAQMNGQYINMNDRQKLLEMSRQLPVLRTECEAKMKAFAAVCQRYGIENLVKWSEEAYIMYEGNPNAKLFKSPTPTK